MKPPLAGIRVLDLSTVVAGPTTSMILSDLGADIIKVERIDGGDDCRQMGPHRGPWGAFFVTLNRGKRSIAVDVTKPGGREVIMRLARTSDVFVENFRGGKAEALGLHEAAIRAQRPDIVYASLSAYGPQGPDYLKPGYDAVLQGRTGIVSVTGPNADTPIRAGVSVLDMGAGVWVALGVLAALFERQRSGQGQRVDGSLYQTGVMLMAYHLVYRQFAGVNPVPQGSSHTAFAPYCALRTVDGAIMLGVSNERMFRRLCDALNQPDWLNDPRFKTNVDRVRNRAALEGGIGAILIERPTAYWTALFDEYDVPFSPIQNAEQVLADPQLVALGQMQEVALGAENEAAIPRLPISLSQTPPAIAGPPPALGEHGRAILSEAGFSFAEIEQLARDGVCKFP